MLDRRRAVRETRAGGNKPLTAVPAMRCSAAMRMLPAAVLVCIGALWLLPSVPSRAGFAEGFAAYDRGDYAAALREWRPLAERGDATAQYNLGFMYDNGQGVPQDYAEAVKWYRKAAEQGHARAQYNLGQMYEEGNGVAEDLVQADLWFGLAAENGLGRAAINRGIVRARMTPLETVRARKLAREWSRAGGPPRQSRRYVEELSRLAREKGLSAPADAAPPSGETGFRVQLAAYRSKQGAEKEIRRLMRVHKTILEGVRIGTVRADLGARGIFYRLRAGPLADRAAARALCRALIARKQDCFVVTRPTAERSARKPAP